MIKPEGEWRLRNGKWYLAVMKKEWILHICKTCIVCGEEFLTRHDSMTCSPKCGAKMRWIDYHADPSRRLRKFGYAFVYLPDHPMSDKKGWIPEHRLVMSQILNRNLSTGEFVHHINGKRDDNRPENLVLLSRSEHNVIHKSKEVSERERDESGHFI